MYGIRLVHTNGVIQFVASSVSKPVLCDDISDMAVFSGYSSVERRLRKMRKEGHEIDGIFDIIKLSYIIDDIIAVPQLLIKKGWALKCQGKYFRGYKNPADPEWGMDINNQSFWTTNPIYASVFGSENQVRSRYHSLLKDQQYNVDHWQRKADRIAGAATRVKYGPGLNPNDPYIVAEYNRYLNDVINSTDYLNVLKTELEIVQLG